MKNLQDAGKRKEFYKMKKAVAVLLAAALAFQPLAGTVAPVYGAQVQAAAAGGGRLEAEISSALLFPYTGRVTVAVSNGKGVQQQKELEIKNGSPAIAEFSGLPAGTYTVTVRSEKFAQYVQTVEVENNWTHRIKVCSAQTVLEGSPVPGWIRPGDVDGDGDIDKDDSDALLAAIQQNQENAACDLNNDGSVDIADLNILVQSLNEKQESSVAKLWSFGRVQAQGTTAVENLEAVLANEGTAVLKTANNQPVSQTNPLSLDITLSDGADVPQIDGMVIKTPAEIAADGTMASQIADGSVEVYAPDGSRTLQLSLDAGQKKLAARTLRRGSASVAMEADGSLVLDFGGQTAVKRVVITITGTTKKDQALAEIAKVDFVNGMENRIPAPQLDIPSFTSVKPGSRQLTAKWRPQQNVTGYELQISGPVKGQSGAVSDVISVAQNSCTVSAIKKKNMLNYKEYTLKVRSVNGEWTSPWSEAATATPAPQKKPDKPDNVSASGGYRSITVTWKDMDDSDGYMVYYKEAGASEFQPVIDGFQQTKEGTGRLRDNQYEITGLKEHASYLVYVVSWNEFGWSGQSLTAEAVTRSEAEPQLPKYRLLNTSNGKGKLTAHIVDAKIGGDHSSMKQSPLDKDKKNSALGLVDDDYSSYWSKSDWDDGVHYPSASKGMTITLDADYQINYFTFAAADQKGSVDLVRVEYWDSKDAKTAKNTGARLLEKRDINDNIYYIVKLNETIKANKIHMSLGKSYSNRTEMRVGEIHFHQYESLEDDIMSMYADEMHTTLKPDVNAAKVQQLKERLETADAASGEKHPLYQELSLEIKTAEEILNGKLAPAQTVSTQITAKKDGHLGFGGLNAWQPLGRTAAAGETLLVYVGHNTKRTGDAADVSLVFTQYHAEAANVSRSVGLKIGRNEITVPKLASTAAERGGQLYVAYTGNNASDKYAVRVNGGSSIPVLDVTGKTLSERKAAVRSYITELEAYVTGIESQHQAVHDGKENTKYAYDQKNCILNATDIVMKHMMYSIPASQTLAALGNGGLEEKAEKLDNALKAMEQMMALFYQHKGLSDSTDAAAKGSNALPSQHLNIRYMRMFAGAFMYAAGNHIGVEWGSTSLPGAKDWGSFGWGICHEIGHNINQGAYAVAEVTNNYFAQLMKSINENGATRFQYQNVYEKVTSNTKGPASNVATQLAMYWQLYLAYGTGTDDARMYDSYQQQFDSLFFARVDTYARNPKKAPKGEVPLSGDSDQKLMRLACAAADKNILAFFERWGMEPDKDTIAYAEKYEKETKAIYYVNEAVRKYRTDNKNETGTVLDQDGVLTAEAQAKPGTNQVTVTIRAAKDKDLIHGYEISRSMTGNGKQQKSVVGFVPAAESGDVTVFTDTIYAVNNRVMDYEVRAVDKYLNYSNAVDAGSVKIQTDGVLDKSAWTVETDMVSADDVEIPADTDNPDSGYDAAGPQNVQQAKANSIERIADGKEGADGTYRGTPKDAKKPAVITIDLHKTEAVTALKYKGSAVASITVELSEDGTKWNEVKTGYQGLAKETAADYHTIWFDSVQESAREEWIGTYDARYVRLKLSVTGEISIQEIEVCGPSGDNLEFYTAGTGQQVAVGILKEDFTYGTKAEDVIPKGSLIFTGTYKGNPAYNLVLLYDTQGNVIGAKGSEVHAGQVIFAKVPQQGNLGETSDGTWVYYVKPGQWKEDDLKQIKGVRGELYRVDDAKEQTGERVVSDTMVITLPSELSQITLEGNKIPD